MKLLIWIIKCNRVLILQFRRVSIFNRYLLNKTVVALVKVFLTTLSPFFDWVEKKKIKIYIKSRRSRLRMMGLLLGGCLRLSIIIYKEKQCSNSKLKHLTRPAINPALQHSYQTSKSPQLTRILIFLKSHKMKPNKKKPWPKYKKVLLIQALLEVSLKQQKELQLPCYLRMTCLSKTNFSLRSCLVKTYRRNQTRGDAMRLPPHSMWLLASLLRQVPRVKS
jgi:hypothetical protein